MVQQHTPLTTAGSPTPFVLFGKVQFALQQRTRAFSPPQPRSNAFKTSRVHFAQQLRNRAFTPPQPRSNAFKTSRVHFAQPLRNRAFRPPQPRSEAFPPAECTSHSHCATGHFAPLNRAPSLFNSRVHFAQQLRNRAISPPQPRSEAFPPAECISHSNCATGHGAPPQPRSEAFPPAECISHSNCGTGHLAPQPAKLWSKSSQTSKFASCWAV